MQFLQGSVALSMNMQINRVDSSGPPLYYKEKLDNWNIYHRVNNTQAWSYYS